MLSQSNRIFFVLIMILIIDLYFEFIKNNSFWEYASWH